MSVHLGDVKNILRAYSIDVQASSVNDLKEVSIHTRGADAGSTFHVKYIAELMNRMILCSA